MPATDRTAQGGIYQIRCLISGKVYIGSAVNIEKRWRSHRWHLAKGRHHSQRLQRAWHKYGADQFAFEVLEIVQDQGDLIRVEQGHLDRLRSYDPSIGFNLRSVAESNLGMKRTAETRARMSAATEGRVYSWNSPEVRARAAEKLRGRKQSPQAVAKRAAAQRGRKRPPHTPEARAKISAAGRGGRPRRVPRRCGPGCRRPTRASGRARRHWPRGRHPSKA